MFTKLKNKIRNKLMDWLGITLLEDIAIQNMKRLKEQMENKIEFSNTALENMIKENKNIIEENKNKIKELSEKVTYNYEAIEVLHNTIQNVVHIGTNVCPNPYSGGSWAVVCLEGKMNIVKFIDLNRGDIRHILDFLKQFEAGKHCIDAPYKEFFYNSMFKFD